MLLLLQFFLYPTESGLIVTSADKWDGSEVRYLCPLDAAVVCCLQHMCLGFQGDFTASSDVCCFCHGCQTITGYNYGAYKLSDFHLNEPDSCASFLRVSRISESLTPRLIQTFYRSNFTMTRPWLTRLLRHMSFLPPSMPGPDEAQVVVVALVQS